MGDAVIHFAQLETERMICQRRISLFNRYMEAFAPLQDAGLAELPIIPEHTTGNGHMFFLMLPDRDKRDRFIAAMSDAQIATPFHYVPLHSAPAGQRFGLSVGPMVQTDRVSDCLARLPMYFDLGNRIEDVIDKVNDVVPRL